MFWVYFIFFFCSLPLWFAHHLNVMVEIAFSFLCVSFIVFDLLFPLYFDITIYMCTESFLVAGLLISNAFPISCICTLLFSWLMVLVSHLCVYFFPLLYVCLYRWAFPLVVFLFLVVAFSFPPRKSSFSICHKAGLVMLNSLSLCWVK